MTSHISPQSVSPDQFSHDIFLNLSRRFFRGVDPQPRFVILPISLRRRCRGVRGRRLCSESGGGCDEDYLVFAVMEVVSDYNLVSVAGERVASFGYDES